MFPQEYDDKCLQLLKEIQHAIDAKFYSGEPVLEFWEKEWPMLKEGISGLRYVKDHPEEAAEKMELGDLVRLLKSIKLALQKTQEIANDLGFYDTVSKDLEYLLKGMIFEDLSNSADWTKLFKLMKKIGFTDAKVAAKNILRNINHDIQEFKKSKVPVIPASLASVEMQKLERIFKMTVHDFYTTEYFNKAIKKKKSVAFPPEAIRVLDIYRKIGESLVFTMCGFGSLVGVFVDSAEAQVPIPGLLCSTLGTALAIQTNSLYDREVADFLHSGSPTVEIDGKNYQKKLVEFANLAVAGKGDGRISVDDAKTIFKKVKKYSKLEKKTLQYIQESYVFTPPASEWFQNQLDAWDDLAKPESSF